MPNQIQKQKQNFYPNQRRVTNHKKMRDGKIDGAGGSMIIAYWADVCLVVKRTGNPLCGLLWEYFFKNEDGYTIGLSPEELAATLGIKKTAYETAFKTLVGAGYLKLREGSRVHYDFIPYPSSP